MRILRALPPWWVFFYYIFLLACLYFFAVIAQGVYAERGFEFDSVILTSLFEQQRSWLTRTALALDFFGISYFLGALVLLAAVLVWRRSRVTSFFLVLGFWGAVGVNLIAKEFFERVRPDLFEQLTPITNSSFPSGHAMGSWAFWLTGLFVFLRLAPKASWLFGILGFIFAVAVGTSRLYLQVHYPSDVLAGWALSTAWVLGVAIWYTNGFRHLRPIKQKPTPVSPI